MPVAVSLFSSMKAITIKQPFASLIAFQEKTIEYRTWATEYRGPLLICAGAKPFFDGEETLPFGVAVAIVQLSGIEPFTTSHLIASGLTDMPGRPGFAWRLTGAKEIEPFRVAGQQRLFDVAAKPVLIDDLSDEDHYDLFAKMALVG